MPTAKLDESLRTGIVAASALEAKQVLRIVNSMERLCNMIKIISAGASLSERGRSQKVFEVAYDVDCDTVRHIHRIVKWLMTEQRVSSEIVDSRRRTGQGEHEQE